MIMANQLAGDVEGARPSLPLCITVVTRLSMWRRGAEGGAVLTIF